MLAAAPERTKRGLDIALRREAERFRKEVIEGFKKQSPGGQRFKPLSKTTLAMRRFQGFKGSKALIRRGDLRRSVTTQKAVGGYFIGVLRGRKSSDGGDLVNIGAVQEFGTVFALRLTPKMRKFLAMALRKAGMPAPRSESGPSSPVAIIRIPPRPFLAPVAKKMKAGAAKRVLDDLHQFVIRS